MTTFTPGTRVRVTLEAEVHRDYRNYDYGNALVVAHGINIYDIPAAVITSVEPIAPEEPTDPAVRVIDFEGEAWASHDGAWHCLTNALGRRTWDALSGVRGPIEVRP